MPWRSNRPRLARSLSTERARPQLHHSDRHNHGVGRMGIVLPHCFIRCQYAGSHPSALIDPDAQVDPSVEIGPYAVVEARAEIGPCSRIGSMLGI